MGDADHIQRFKRALGSKDPARELPRLAISLRDEGVSQIALYKLFAHFQGTTSGENPAYDAIVDTMDLIWGGPWAKGNALFATELDEREIHGGEGA